MRPAFCVIGSSGVDSGAIFHVQPTRSRRPVGRCGNGWRGAGVDRLCAGFGFSIKPTRNVDDPARTASDRFADTLGGAAEGAAEERASGAHEVEPGIQVEVEPIKNRREVGEMAPRLPLRMMRPVSSTRVR